MEAFLCLAQTSSHALPTARINLSPFTKDFRVGGVLIEYSLFVQVPPEGLLTSLLLPLTKLAGHLPQPLFLFPLF